MTNVISRAAAISDDTKTRWWSVIAHLSSIAPLTALSWSIYMLSRRSCTFAYMWQVIRKNA